MDSVKGKKNFLVKTWERCKSIPAGDSKKKTVANKPLFKSRSWSSSSSSKNKSSHLVAPHGCFSVYVGQERRRFVIKTEYASHPLFKMLLEDAEMEYGYSSEGPLLLPCEVDLFYKVLAEMDSKDGKETVSAGCGSCSPFTTPARRLGGGGGGGSSKGKGYGPYALLTPPRLLRVNQF